MKRPNNRWTDVLYLGVLPSRLIDIAQQSIVTIF
jgi:hypothetical protein